MVSYEKVYLSKLELSNEEIKAFFLRLGVYLWFLILSCELTDKLENCFNYVGAGRLLQLFFYLKKNIFFIQVQSIRKFLYQRISIMALERLFWL